MKWRPKATRSASPNATAAAALSPVKPPAAMMVRLNFRRRCWAATGAWPLTISSMPLIRGSTNVEVGDAQPIELGRDIAKGRGRVAVRHRTVAAARRDTDAHAVGAPDGDRS